MDPKKSHPTVTIEYVFFFILRLQIHILIVENNKITTRVPLPEEIPIVFRILPEFFLEDVVDFLLFLMRYVLSATMIKFYPHRLDSIRFDSIQELANEPRPRREERTPHLVSYIPPLYMVHQKPVFESKDQRGTPFLSFLFGTYDRLG